MDTFLYLIEPVAGRTVDSEKLKMGKYSLAIIMSSSKDGAFFNGCCWQYALCG